MSTKNINFHFNIGRNNLMGFFDRLFGKDSEPSAEPDIRFGRYSDSYKEESQYDFWDSSLAMFDNEEYLPAYQKFFNYLLDNKEDNVKYWEKDGGIQFEVYQGSKKITGFANKEKVTAEAKIARTDALDDNFMRRLLEQNYSLKYCRFTLDPDNVLSIKFDTYTLDGSPYKLYYAFKELATNADKQDDLLVDEFQSLQPVEINHLKELPPKEKEVKYNFIIHEIKSVLTEIENGKLDPEQYPGAIAYLLLNLCYELDYLIKPEGFMMETLERIHRKYFEKNTSSTKEKNDVLIEELTALYQRPKEDFFKEMYRVKSTFGITTPANHDRVISFIDGELGNMDWYNANGHDKVARAVPGYIVGFCLFNYAVPQPDRDFLHLYYKITKAQYFQDLGFANILYNPKSKTFDKKAIKKAIKNIQEKNKEKFPRVNPNVGRLNFDSIAEFSRSYLIMIRNLDMVVAG